MSELRNWALAAFNMEMDGGDYVFLYVNQQTATEELYDQLTSTALYTEHDNSDDDARTAMESFFLVSISSACIANNRSSCRALHFWWRPATLVGRQSS